MTSHAEKTRSNISATVVKVSISLFVLIMLIIGFMAYQSSLKDVGANTSKKSEASTSRSESLPVVSEESSGTAPNLTDENVNGCYTPATVRNHYGESGCIDYSVGYVFETSAGTKFIDEKSDYQNGFVAYIPYDSSARTIDIHSLLYKKVRVEGFIEEYEGHPQITINSSDQVKVYN